MGQEFRNMRRFKQQVPDEECIAILKEQWRGVLSLLGDNGYPYGVPIDYFYDEETGKIYFHGAREGHKIDAVKACEKASFCVWNEGFRKEGDWALNITSVIVFGRIHIVEDRDRNIEIARKIALKYYPDAEGAEEEVRKAGNRVTCLEMQVEHMTGKLVNES